MRAKLTFLRALVVGTLSGVLTSACQTYDFEPVEPLAISQTTETRTIEARALKPNLMLLVDTSGSMTAPVNPTLPACRVNGTVCGSTANPCDVTKCPTRWSDLQDAMSSFLDESGTIARIGLATYPEGDSCGASSGISVPLPEDEKEDDATLKENARKVKASLLAIKNSGPAGSLVPQGGTPTSSSLAYVGSRPELRKDNRADFVVLLTDGLPNCNENYPTPGPSQDCFCILSSCAPESGTERIGCLDTNASVAAVKALRNSDEKLDIQTIVIGFGTDFKANTEAGIRGAATLQGMGVEGGFERKCSTNADCGTDDTCTAGKCKRSFFEAENKTQLSQALRAIAEEVIAEAPCELRIDPAERPTSEELMVVYLNGERLSPGPDTWVMKEPGIVFQGSTCDRIEASSPSAPAKIEVRAVQRR
ncbi:CglB [Cystobacter fuscus DSM 2262]|uniref:CglB n=1 Tax=Cystobacter fuscus (strain ATCC 25194 / DSM 2262 / NBRC 100088 / M29) TaxID=1242864 RepID=S9Q309_CYSF2|nr:adventurous gliding motility lipoprotein CglB [Cystobacter fuscus]EPX55689.1 CglB [Cystobacter fuscus DSM 2262]